MNKIIAMMMATLLFSSVAIADCKEIYKKQKIKVGTKTALSTVGGAALTGAGVGVFYLGVIVAVLASQNAFIVIGAGAGLGTSAGAVMVSVKGVKNGKEFLKKARAYKLIKESYVGAGNNLNDAAEELSELLGRDITAEEVASIVVAADQSNKYCQTEDSIYNIDQVMADLADQV